LKLNCTHQLFVYAGDVNVLGGSIHTTKKNTAVLVVASKENVLGGSIHTTKKNTAVLVVASKENGIEVNADKNKYTGHASRSECRMKSPYKD